MKDHISHLAEILKIDQSVQSLKEELDEIPAKVRALETQLQAIEEEYQTKKTESDKIELERRRIKDELTEESTRLKNKEERLHLIKTNKEYQAILKEISTGKTVNREKEAKLLQLDTTIETLTKEISPLEEQRNELKTTLEKEQQEIQGTLDTLTANLKEAESRLTEQLLSLPEDIRHKYRKVQEKRQPPIAKIVDGTCQECFINIPPQLFIEIQKHQEIYSCPNCHRLLYIEL